MWGRMAELEWHLGSEVEWYGDVYADSSFVAKGWLWRTRYYVVREIKEGWMVVEHRNDDFDNGWSFGVYSTIEAAKAAADEFENGPPRDPSALLQLIDWAKEAGRQDLVDRCQAQYDADQKRGPRR